MRARKLRKNILVSITGKKKKEWEDKLKEINKRKIKRAALFLSAFPEKEREGLQNALLNSCIKKIPLIHLREEDVSSNDILFYIKNFKTKYFTVHESYFKNLNKWKRFHKKLYLELDYNNKLSKKVMVKKIGGFCIDLSHFKISSENFSKEFFYILNKRKIKKYFKCNHLNGYNPKKNEQMHVIKSLKDFDYLSTLPKFVFGKIIAIETWNSISEQLKFKKRIIEILKERL